MENVYSWIKPLFLAIVAAILFLFAGFFAIRPLYGATQSSSDGKTKYWEYSEKNPVCFERDIKRPVVAVDSLILFYARLVVSGTIHADDSMVKDWREQQGNCPYQVMDIYKTRVPADLIVLALLVSAGAVVTYKRQKTAAKNT